MSWAALSELVPYYPLYALLFLDTGLSEAQISVLFALWSITAFVAEVPTGALADRWSRRGALVLAGGLQAAAFVIWTAAPGLVAFAVGFVVWGVGGALMSGTSEAAPMPCAKASTFCTNSENSISLSGPLRLAICTPAWNSP